MSNAMIVHTCY